ncbi:MAG TPA: hypothetical protein VLA49_09665 [Anaerolineales bacterium]|nr:hypothetical protein [Anaerolineales bacterium]
MKKIPIASFFILLSLIAASLACNFSSGSDDQSEATLQALQDSVAKTSTAAAGESSSSSNDLATAQAEATARSLEIVATQTAGASTRDESQLATATIAAPVVAELPLYGGDPEKGRLAWMHPPVTVEIEGYRQFGHANDFMHIIARDFILAADITWDTQYGASGCGFMFRSDGDQKFPNQYMVVASRIGQGHVIFSALADGELANVHDFYANTLDPAFEWQNGTTNRLAVVARGNLVQIYTNGTKIGELDTTVPPPPPVLPKPPQKPLDQSDLNAMSKYQALLKEHTDLVNQVQSNYQIALSNYKTREAVFEQGFVAMLALSESGRTSCQFDNAWLWLIEE